MEKTLSINVADINDDGCCNLLVVQKIYDDGELIARKNWRCVLPKNTNLTVPIQTAFGEINIDVDFPPEATFLRAKWAE